MGESGYTLGFRRKNAHSGSHAETGAFPPPATVRLCAASEIFYSATLLYTYISRFSVNPHHRQKRKSRRRCHRNSVLNRFSSRFLTSPTNGPRSLSQTKMGTHSALGERSHTRAHTAKHRAFRTGALLLPSERSARSRTSPGRVPERQTLPLLGLGRVCSRRTQRAFAVCQIIRTGTRDAEHRSDLGDGEHQRQFIVACVGGMLHSVLPFPMRRAADPSRTACVEFAVVPLRVRPQIVGAREKFQRPHGWA